jgi:hypothetical protein
MGEDGMGKNGMNNDGMGDDDGISWTSGHVSGDILGKEGTRYLLQAMLNWRGESMVSDDMYGMTRA